MNNNLLTHTAPHEPLARTYITVDIDDLVYDLENQRINEWTNDGKPFTTEAEYEVALRAHSNFNKLRTSIRRYGILEELKVTPFTARGNKFKYRVFAGNTRLCAARSLNAQCLRDSVPLLIKKVLCISFDPAVVGKTHVMRVAEHRLPAKAWPVAERVWTCLRRFEAKQSVEHIAVDMMLPEAQVHESILAGQFFECYLTEAKLRWEQAEKKMSFFAEAAHNSSDGFDTFMDTTNGRKEFASWIIKGKITRANPEVRNLAKLMDTKTGKGIGWVQKQLTAKDMSGLMRTLSLDDYKTMGLRDAQILAG